MQSQCFRIILLICMILGLSGSLRGEENKEEVISPMQDFGLLRSKVPGTSLKGGIYASTSKEARWNIGQWGNDKGELSDWQKLDYTSSLVSRNSFESVILKKSDGKINIELDQNGSSITCDENGTPKEYDLFFGPNSGSDFPASEQGLSPERAQKTRLTQLEALVVHGELTIKFEDSVPRVPCVMNEGNVLLGIVLSNSVTNPPQTLFYQLILHRGCGSHVSPSRNRCMQRPSKELTYSASNPFGVDDYPELTTDVASFHEGKAEIDINLLGRLKATIANRCCQDIDTDLSHWFVSAFYAGQHIWGGVRLGSNWSNIRLIASEKHS